LDRIILLGAGKIGAAIAELLGASGDFELTVADRDARLLGAIHRHDVRSVRIDVEDRDALAKAMTGHDAVVSALPFHLNPTVAAAARAVGLHCFDLTEDVKTTRAVREMADGAETVFMPQCGLAPGFISIAAAALAREFTSLDAVRMRVGALPQFPTNALT